MLGHPHHVAMFFPHPYIDEFVMSTAEATKSGVALNVLHEPFEHSIAGVKDLHGCNSIECRCMEHMSFFSASNGPIEGVDVPLLHEFVNCKKGALIENLIKYTTIHPLKFARAQNALQFVLDFFEDAGVFFLIHP